MIKIKYFKKKNQGYALLLAILLTSTILISAAALARVTLLSLRQGQNIDRATAAFYIASSGVEKGLFLARRVGQDLARHSQPIIDETLGEEAHLIVTAEETGETDFKIKENDFVVLDLPAEYNVSELRISSWAGKTSCADDKTSWLEVSVAKWDSTNGFEQISRHPYSVNDVNDYLTINDLPPVGAIVQVRLKALYCDINKLTVQGVSGGELGPLPSRLAIKAVGTYRGVSQALQAMILEKTPLSGFFDFVLFSECPLVKGAEAGNCYESMN